MVWERVRDETQCHSVGESTLDKSSEPEVAPPKQSILELKGLNEIIDNNFLMIFDND